MSQGLYVLLRELFLPVDL